MNTGIEVMLGHREISGCHYINDYKLVVKPLVKEDWTHQSMRRTIWTIPEDIHIPSSHDSRFSAKKGITAIFQYSGYKTVTPLSPTIKLFIYHGVEPHEAWTLVLLNTECSKQVHPKDFDNYIEYTGDDDASLRL